eukprot:4556695-Heterocapsa_arctica.AAC.1
MVNNYLYDNVYDDNFFFSEDQTFQISKIIPKKKRMPMVRSSKDRARMVVDSLDDEESEQRFDVLGVEGNGT